MLPRPQSSQKILLAISLILGVVTPLSFAASAQAATISPQIESSEPISIDNSSDITKVYLTTFRPNMRVDFKIVFGNTETLTVNSDGTTINLTEGEGLQLTSTSESTLPAAAIGRAIHTIKDRSGNTLVAIYPTPPDFPSIAFSGDTSLIKSRDILSTPVVSQGSYALDSVGTAIRYFVKSSNNIIGFRKLNDSVAGSMPGGTAQYAFLEQKVFSVSATSPGVWLLLDSGFNTIGDINDLKTKFGEIYADGHDITTSPVGNPLVITTPPRAVDSSWLKRQYKLPILDCDIAEIRNGAAIHEFSFWDWAVANKAITEPILDSMQLFNDPQNPLTSPIDICHANSVQYYKPLNEYLISLRSPSLLLIMSSDLKTVKSIIPADSSLQHFARFISPTEITALGNYPFTKHSAFLDFTLLKGQWTLKKVTLPVDVGFCGNINRLDASHIWLAGGCGTFEPNTLGAIYKVSGENATPVGKMTISNFIYSYRADLPK